jgi:hypothetical protein
VKALVSTVLLATIAAACVPGPGVEDYGKKVAEDRALKDESFRNSSESPVPADKKYQLLPLAYYPVDEQYRAGRVRSCRRTNQRLQIPHPPASCGLRTHQGPEVQPEG